MEKNAIKLMRWISNLLTDQEEEDERPLEMARRALKQIKIPMEGIEYPMDLNNHYAHVNETLLRLEIPPPEITPEDLEGKLQFPTMEHEYLLLLDLDETLVHRSENVKGDVLLPFQFDAEFAEIWINIRPFLRSFLRKMCKIYDVGVFTASTKRYADVVLDYIDPRKEYIKYRYYRSSCIHKKGLYYKNLRIFANVPINNIVLVDNHVHSFRHQLHNGIPIQSWFDDKQDMELFKLTDYLTRLAESGDIRGTNAEAFKLHSFLRTPKM